MAVPKIFRLNPFSLLLMAAIVLTVWLSFFSSEKLLPIFHSQIAPTIESKVSRYNSSFICNPCTGPAVHSATIVSRLDGGVMAAWFGGSREGARDVKIFSSSRIIGTNSWSAEKSILSRSESSQELNRYIKKLGNPVLGRDKAGRLWLFYVSVSAGGWSGSAINYQISSDEGKTWSSSRRLIASPFFNVSTLVRGSPIAHVDGSISLPVYHELLGKFTELLHISPDGEVLAKRRISHGRESFQPSMTLLSDRSAFMIMRHKGKSPARIMISRTSDAGQTWTSPVKTSLPNPDAGVSIATGPENSLLVVYNDSENHRGNLALAISRDSGATWKKLHFFERDSTSGPVEEYSYPSIIRQGDQYHLVYTWKRKGIRYVTFNNAWLKKQEGRR